MPAHPHMAPAELVLEAGLGGNLIIIDDPLKLGDAMSETVRSRVIEWYR